MNEYYKKLTSQGFPNNNLSPNFASELKVRKNHPSLAFLSLTFQEALAAMHAVEINLLMSQTPHLPHQYTEGPSNQQGFQDIEKEFVSY